MYKKQEILFERGYMINDNGNIGLDIEIKYTKYKMSQYDDGYMY